MQEQKICPYPGLRPFNEEESIFFRGREEHIEKIIGQLEEKKFVMLTGASGDGKSSLIYAGVIPSARAGFFKAKFNNWLIADFRPERTPLKNLAESLATKLNLEKATVESELSFGFSSLVNLYKKSAFHLDYNAPNYTNAEEVEKKKLKRKAANLFILVDQFEEFFTNPENYKNGQASNESQLIVNLLLETAKIALAEDLPIYIVCTMRSDYIGQCAAFRGLPEYIGYSQFFVPRLKRKEIHQVISEPAMLSGNSISSRLVETLINEIGDGFDQLPVLQHALNRIWNKTNKGEYPMDLLQLAMVGGLPSNQLPESDKAIFEGWFSNVAENKKLFFKTATLNAVLNAHAHELYESAHELYNTQNIDKLEKEKAQLIIKTAFQCLTKIDDSRAVRNRMSLQEITNIINDSTIPVEKVDNVLRIFRLQGNTFIKPFVTADNEKERLAAETVLDITHESLIRNWELLEQWAKEEHDNRLTFEDFYKQLQRWIANEKANGFLLPIGPLTFFENWFNTCKPNKYWLARYDSSNLSKADKLKKAEETLNAAKEFIGSSARNLFFSRTVLKYGASKIIAVVGIILLVIACTYYYFDFQKKQNSNVIANITSKGIELLNSPDVSVENKADFLINSERLNQKDLKRNHFDFESILNDLKNDSIAFDIALEMLHQCQTIQRNDSLPYDKQGLLSRRVYNYLYEVFQQIVNAQLVAIEHEKIKELKLNQINQFLLMIAKMKNYYVATPHYSQINDIAIKSITLTKKLLQNSLQRLVEKVDVAIDISLLNNCIVTLVAIDEKPQFENLIKYYQNIGDATSLLNLKYAALESYNLDGREFGNGFSEILSILYITQLDKNPKVLNHILNQIGTNYRRFGKYTSENILYAALEHCTNNKYLSVILDSIEIGWNKRCIYFGDDSYKIEKCIASINLISNNYLFDDRYPRIKKYNPCMHFISPVNQEILHIRQLRAILKSKNRILSIENALSLSYLNYNDSLKLLVANYFKELGNYYYEIRKNNLMANRCYFKSLNCIQSIPNQVLYSQTITKDIFSIEPQENYIFIYYPKLFGQSFYQMQTKAYTATVPADFNAEKVSRVAASKGFSNFLKTQQTIYNSIEFEKTILFYLTNSRDLNWRAYWELIYTFEKSNLFNITRTNVNFTVYSDTTKNVYHYVALPLMKIMLHLDRGDTTAANSILYASFDDIKQDLSKDVFLTRLIKEASILYAKKSCLHESLKLIRLIKNYELRRNLLLNICYTLQNEGPIENTFVYINELFKVLNTETDAGSDFFRILGKIGGKNINEIAQSQLRKTPEHLKPQALQNLIKGIAERGNYYEALQYLPDYISESKELSLYNEILKAEIIKRENKNAKNATSGNWNDAAFFKLDLSAEGTNLGNVSLD